ncbi:uncharacterized protein LOC113321449 isoform X2 [Papaver somniferum]|uniref:uncharacterized protein LOC113321449 isoform X2 n=1 Tax=Papaver somniferum TaxID=3469 RepID=UPI000E701E24|nr:uncharacterized protein LOC113321449 isoform X2 [Papaver somniferum]
MELADKHPIAPSPTIPVDTIPCEALTVDTTTVLKVIKSFPKGTSCGRDGLRAQHLLDAMSGAANSVADELLSSITKVINLWLSGKCPSVLGKFIASAPLTPLQNPGGGIQPIAVGTIWRRLVSKLEANKVGKDMSMVPVRLPIWSRSALWRRMHSPFCQQANGDERPRTRYHYATRQFYKCIQLGG